MSGKEADPDSVRTGSMDTGSAAADGSGEGIADMTAGSSAGDSGTVREPDSPPLSRYPKMDADEVRTMMSISPPASGGGENITAAMKRAEGMMDKVVEGFEKQLDQLFQGDALDITTDVEVLERMLSKDGLSSKDGIRLEL